MKSCLSLALKRLDKVVPSSGSNTHSMGQIWEWSSLSRQGKPIWLLQWFHLRSTVFTVLWDVSRSLPLSEVKNRTIAYSFPTEKNDFLVKTITSLDCNLHFHLQDHLFTLFFFFFFAQACFTFYPTHSTKANNYCIFTVCQVLF